MYQHIPIHQIDCLCSFVIVDRSEKFEALVVYHLDTINNLNIICDLIVDYAGTF